MCPTWMSPEGKNGADDSLAAFVKEKLELLGSGKSCVFWWKLQVTLGDAAPVLGHRPKMGLSFCHPTAKTGPSLPRNLCCRGLQEAGAAALSLGALAREGLRVEAGASTAEDPRAGDQHPHEGGADHGAH